MFRRCSFALLLVCQLIIWIGYKNPLANTLLDPITSLQVPDGDGRKNKTEWAKRARSKRDIWQLYGVITCMTPCDPFVLKDYGCYCGLGGTGRPVDHIDKCCMYHDYCYHNTPCHQALTYFLPYNWKCIAGRPYCSNLESERWPHTYSCSARLCECDRMFSECINAYGCPTHKAVCKSSQIRRVWQKFLIKIGIG